MSDAAKGLGAWCEWLMNRLCGAETQVAGSCVRGLGHTGACDHEETAQALTLKNETQAKNMGSLLIALNEARARESKLSGEYLKLNNELVAARNQIAALQQKCLMERDAHDKDGKALLVCQKQLAEEREAHKTLRLRDARSWSLELLDALSKRVEKLESKLSFEQRIPEIVEGAIVQLNQRMGELEKRLGPPPQRDGRFVLDYGDKG